MALNKLKVILFMLVMCFSHAFAEKDNPIKDYISDEVFNEAEDKFKDDKNFFKSEVQVKPGTATNTQAKSDLNSIFIKVNTIIRKDRKWGCIVFYKERNEYTDVVTKRKVILGNTIIKVSGLKYFLKPDETGVEIREVVSGNTIYLKLEKGR